MATPFPSYYARLGIGPSASPEEIRWAFRAAVKRLPPTGAQGQWRAVLEAYAVLRDPIARRKYDARCRGWAWGRQIAARLPPRRNLSSRLRLMLWLGLVTSRWAISHLITKRDRESKIPPKRSRRAICAAPQDRRVTAVALLDAFVDEVRWHMAMGASPGELARVLSALLVRYRSAAARHLRDLQGAAFQQRMDRPCPREGRDALALMAIWGLKGHTLEGTETRIPRGPFGS
ncbi:MAG: DnaJ domain-containing protein [Candidatus Methylomirabilales bacterium]